MKHLKLKPNPKNSCWSHTKDIKRIVNVFADKGFQISESDAIESWKRRSDDFLLFWMNMSSFSDSEIYSFLKDYFEEIQK